MHIINKTTFLFWEKENAHTPNTSKKSEIMDPISFTAFLSSAHLY